MSHPIRRSHRLIASSLAAHALAFGILAVFPDGSHGQEVDKTKAHPATAPVSEIRDLANLFSRQAVAAGRTQLERVSRDSGVSIAIETVDSLNDEPPIDVARRLAGRWHDGGVFILIAKKERVLEELVTKSETIRLTEGAKTAIRAAFLDEFRHKNFDRGLSRGIAALAEHLTGSDPTSAAIRLPGPGESTSARVKQFSDSGPLDHSGQPTAEPLVERNRVRLTLRGARAVIAAAESKALTLTRTPKFNIAVVDDGGHLIAFERMDDARPASAYTAITKATSAATFRQPTGPANRAASPLPTGSPAPPASDPLLSLSLQNASGGRITSLEGGIPIVVDGQVIGAVGIGGGVGEQDAEIGRFAVQSFLDQIERSHVAEPAKEPAKPASPVKPPAS